MHCKYSAPVPAIWANDIIEVFTGYVTIVDKVEADRAINVSKQSGVIENGI